MYRIVLSLTLYLSAFALGDKICDWALETMSMSALDKKMGDVYDRLTRVEMFDTIDVEPGQACHTGGASVCTAFAIVNTKTGRAKMAHFATKNTEKATAYIVGAIADLGDPKDLKVVMAGNQSAATRIDDDYAHEVKTSDEFADALRTTLSQAGVPSQQIRDFLSSNAEEYMFDLIVDTVEKKIYLGRKKVKLVPNDPARR